MRRFDDPVPSYCPTSNVDHTNLACALVRGDCQVFGQCFRAQPSVARLESVVENLMWY